MLRELLLYGEQLRPRCAVLADKVITPAVAAFLKELTESAQSIELLVKSHIKDAFWQKKLLESSLKLQESLDEESVRAHRTYEDIVSMLEDRRIRTELQHVVSRLGRVETAEHDKENLLQYARELVRQKRGYHGRANQAAK
jgi:hypothetical protein